MDEKFVTQVQFNGLPLVHMRPSNLREGIETLVKDESGRVLDIYPLLGSHNDDLIVVCTFPDNTAALKAWMAIGTRFGWRTQTNPTFDPVVFQEIYEEVSSVPVGATSSIPREITSRR